MKRIAAFPGLLALGLLIGAASAQQPGTVVISGEYLIAGEGCLAYLNNAQMLRRHLCSFSVVAEGVKLTDLSCAATLSDSLTPYRGKDTVIDCTYSPGRSLVTNFRPDLDGPAGQLILNPLIYSLGPDGCCVQLNNPGNAMVLHKCGFNVVLLGLAVPGMQFSVSVRDGNTTLVATYPPVKL